MPQILSQPHARRIDTDRSEWTPSLAECVARFYGIDPLTEPHWRVISECRESWATSGIAPAPAMLAALARLTVAELRELFPSGPPSLAWILAGFPPPSNPSGTSTGGIQPGVPASVDHAAAPFVAQRQGDKP